LRPPDSLSIGDTPGYKVAWLLTLDPRLRCRYDSSMPVSSIRLSYLSERKLETLCSAIAAEIPSGNDAVPP